MSEVIFQEQRVLVLEDEPIIAMLLEQMLEDAGAEVDGHATLASAEAALNGTRPDMAILDINIHNDTSYALAGRLVTMGVPLIFASGYGAGAHPEGFASIPTVTKPYDITDIAAALQQAMSVGEA
ncbi:MAG: response regulator [Novosphingobium sp.]